MPVVATTAHGSLPARDVRRDQLRERVRPHREGVVVRDDAHVLAAEPREQRGLLDRAVALRRDVDRERPRLGLQARRGRARSRWPARGRRAARSGSRSTPCPGSRPLHASDSPTIWRTQSHDDFFQLGERGAGLPVQPEHAEAGAQQVAEHARRATAFGGEVAEEPRVLPVRQAGHEDRVEVREDRVERLGFGRRRRREARPSTCARLGRAPSPAASECRAVVGDPVDELVAVLAELVGGHRALRLLSAPGKRL